ncbi:hypothetical protein OEB99_19500 [Actinotalea sp. M2MS4P-6]|uniref:hypothetical protein n=1 Tax=Actinotalea sp. M2MS4P-6 TaxID=2983762 RepID=UPI0021E3B459|nr:hypothetical protein [Actinotalea sp. M2MS4P-6]MCV2396502.1 hypothetical protein [Actinotalea sp. M2MS4P-6]
MLIPVRPTSPSGLAVMRRVAIAYFAAVGVMTVALPVFVPHSTASAVAHRAAGVALLACAATLVVNGRASRASIEVLAVASLGLVGVLVWLSEPVGIEPWLALGPVLLLAAFSGTPALVTGLVVMVVAIGCGIALRDLALVRLDLLVGPTVGALLLALGVRMLRAGPGAGSPDGDGAPLDLARLRPRLETLAEAAIAAGDQLAVALVAPAGAGGPDQLRATVRVLAERSRSDDLVALLPEGVAVVLPGARPADAIVYAARVTLAADAAEGLPDGVVAGVGTMSDAADTTDVLLRRARRALRAAADAGPGHVAVHGPYGAAVHVAADVAAVPGSGGRDRA